MQEEEQLREENALLRAEVEELKRLVQTANTRGDEAEDELLRVENEYLRAKLKEQLDFLRNCRELIKALPADSKDSIADERAINERALLLEQGGENSITLLNMLVNRCQQNPAAWRAIKLPTQFFHSPCVPGFNVTSSFQRETIREGEEYIHLRVDGCFPNVSPETVASGYFKTWFDEQALGQTIASTMRGRGGAKADAEEVEVVPYSFKELMSTESEAGTSVRVVLYQEKKEDASSARDWIYCLARREREQVAMSTLALPSELNPTVATRRDQHTRRVVPVEGEFCPRKRTRGCASASQLMGMRECIIVARSSMKGMGETERTVNKHAIATDGLFVWQDEVSIDYEVQCAEGKEMQRKRVPAARACSFVSLASDALPIQNLAIFSNVVDSVGTATERYAKLIDFFYRVMAGDGGGGGT